MPNPLVWPRAFVVGDQVGAWGCWAAVLESVTAYYLAGKYTSVAWKPTQESIQSEYADAGGAAGKPGSAKDLELAVKLTGHLGWIREATETSPEGRTQFLPTSQNFQLIKDAIDNGHPVVCILKYHTRSVKHAVLVYGYEENPRAVLVGDPAGGVSRKTKWSFDEFCNAYREHTHLIKICETKENEFANLRSLFA